MGGTVRLAAPETIATHLLLPALRPLIMQHPSLELEIVTGIASVGIARGEADIALRVVAPKRGALTIRKVGTMRYGLYARADAERDITSARLVGWTDEQDLPASRWLQRLTGRAADIRFNHLDAHRAAIAAGLGIGILPCFLGADLLRLPVPFIMEEPLWLVAHAGADIPVRIRLIYDAVADIMAANAAQLTGHAANMIEMSEGS